MSHHRFLNSERTVRRYSVAIFVAMVSLCSLSRNLHAQSKNYGNFGTEFYVAFGPNLGADESTNVMDIYITSYVPTHGSVEVPALNFFKSFTSTPGQITTIVLPSGRNFSQTVELSENQDEQVIHGMAVHITSDSSVAVFGLNHKLYSSDAFMGFPINVLGTEYRTMNYKSSSAGGFGNQLTPGEFWIVAVNDSTNVTITLKDVSSLGTPANSPINVRLNKGDIYLIQGGENRESNDLTGSLIESDQPIAVFSGHRRTEMPQGAVNVDGTPSRDHLVEQLPPVSAWGDSALVVPYATSALPDLVRVVCAEDGTRLTVNGNLLPQTFNAGDFYEITKLGGVTSIQATNPIEVGQYMHTSYGGLENPPPAYGDPALALVFPVEQFTNAYTIVSIVDANSYTGNFVNIVADASSIGTMLIDGIPMNPSEFHPIPNSHFAYAQHSLAQGTHNITGGSPFGVTVYALGNVDSYSYTGGTLLKTITPLKTVGLVIDFGDRVLSAANLVGPGFPGGTFDTTVILQNVSEDTVNIYSFPKRIQDTDRFNVDSTTDGLVPPLGIGLPLTVAPLTTDVFRIQFHPHELGRRMHTQITAKTDHLRAYVVDVYGRGVQDEMGIFRDTNKTLTIDTLDFGTFEKTDLAEDSEVYVGNAGTAAMNVTASSVTSHSVSAAMPGGVFTQTGITYQGSAIDTPFSIAEPPSGAARINLQFTPTGLGNGTYYDSLIVTSISSKHVVILVGHVETISALAPNVNAVSWGSTAVCDDSEFNVLIPNPNNLPVTITAANIIGANASDFAVSTRTPLVIPAGQIDTVQVNFLPTGRGIKNAQVVLAFNLPKNTPNDTITLSGTGDKPTIELAAAQNIHAYILDNYFLMPIYATTDLAIIGCDGYHVYVNYDSINLRLLDIVTTGTLTPQGYLSIQSSNPPGHDTINFQQGGEGSSIGPTLLTGGGCSEGDSGCLPLLYLKFQAITPGADPLTFQKGFPINFTMTFDDARLPYTCADHVFDSGYVVVGSVCDTQFLEQQPSIPDAMMLGSPKPNPANVPLTVQYDVASVGDAASTLVSIDVVNPQGSLVMTLVNDDKQPGYYTATIDPASLPSGLYFVRMSAGNYHRVRNLVIQK